LILENFVRDSFVFLHYTSGEDASNLLRFNLPVFSSRNSAYVLYSCGASQKFVKNAFLKRLREEGLKIRTRMCGYMVVTTAGSEERIPRYESLLELDMGGYIYRGWFIHFDLLRYDIIMGKDCMATIKHSVDHEKNILYLGWQGGTWHHTVVGLHMREQKIYEAGSVEHLKVLEREVPEGSAMTVPRLLKNEIQGLLKRFEGVFVEPVGLPPDHQNCGFRTRLKPNSNPPPRSPYRLTVKEKAAYEKTIQQLLSKRHIRPSSSPYAAPVMFVQTAGGGPDHLRMVIDFRELNRPTVKDQYPLPHGEELIDRLQGSKVFSKLDFWAGFHQHRMAPGDIKKTAFIGPDSLYEWLVKCPIRVHAGDV